MEVDADMGPMAEFHEGHTGFQEEPAQQWGQGVPGSGCGLVEAIHQLCMKQFPEFSGT